MQRLQTKKGKDNAIYSIYSGSKEELMLFNSAIQTFELFFKKRHSRLGVELGGRRATKKNNYLFMSVENF